VKPAPSRGLGIGLRPIALVLVIASFAGRADAFVRRVERGKQVFWKQTCVPFTLYFNGFDRSPNKVDFSTDATIKSVVAAAHAWSADAVTCPSGGGPYLELVPSVAAIEAKPPEVAYDAKNSIIFRTTDKWGTSKIDYAAEALAVTTVTGVGSDGHLIDVDIEINATNSLQLWMNLDPGTAIPLSTLDHGQDDGRRYYDLQTALTHEFGHFIGLNHTCSPADAPAVEDDQGRTIPVCGEPSPPAVQATVMYARIEAGQIAKRRLSDDEIRGVCAIYPPSGAAVAEVCKMDDPPPGCAVATRARPLASVALLAGAAVALLARRGRVSDRRRARS
jgi:hypothetical protein